MTSASEENKQQNTEEREFEMGQIFDGPGMAYNPDAPKVAMGFMGQPLQGMNMEMCTAGMCIASGIFNQNMANGTTTTVTSNQTCSACGKSVAETDKFCTGCGAKLIRV